MIFCTNLQHLDESKINVPIGFLKKILVFEILAKNGQFLPFLAIFSKKSWFGHFLRIHTSDLSKTWSETWDSCFESFKGSFLSRKILPFLPFLGQKYIACGDIIWFWAVFGHFLRNCLWFFVNFCYLNQVYCLKMVNETLGQKMAHSWAFWWKIAIFTIKSVFFCIFFETAHQIYLKLCQKLRTIALSH